MVSHAVGRQSLAEGPSRLRAAAPKDANVNALIILHSFAEAVPDTIEDQLDELGFLFQRS